MAPNYCTTLLFWLLIGTLSAQDSLPKSTIILDAHTTADFKQTVLDLSEAPGIEVIYRQDPVIGFTYASEELRTAAMLTLYNRSYNVSTKSGVPLDYPILPANAAQEEIDNFVELKSNWIEANPQRYEEMNQSTEVFIISQEEFEQMPSAKQQYILDHPELYSIE